MSNNHSSYVSQLRLAERELGAFISAVTESYGSEQGSISAEDWVDKFESMDGTPEFTNRELQLITIAPQHDLRTA